MLAVTVIVPVVWPQDTSAAEAVAACIHLTFFMLTVASTVHPPASFTLIV